MSPPDFLATLPTYDNCVTDAPPAYDQIYDNNNTIMPDNGLTTPNMRPTTAISTTTSSQPTIASYGQPPPYQTSTNLLPGANAGQPTSTTATALPQQDIPTAGYISVISAPPPQEQHVYSVIEDNMSSTNQNSTNQNEAAVSSSTDQVKDTTQEEGLKIRMYQEEANA